VSANIRNPLLRTQGLPAFSEIAPEHVVPAIDAVLAESRRTVERVLAKGAASTWEDLVEPIEDMDERLNRTWSPVQHLHSVADAPALRDAYNACLPRLSDWESELGQNERLYAAYRGLRESAGFEALDVAQRKIVDNALREFRLAGVHLDGADKRRYRELSRRLSELSSRFEENVMDATQGWREHVRDPSELRGLPQTALALARQVAQRDGLDGWVLNLEFPCYFAVITYAENRALRREMYEAYTTRASDRGPHAGRWDNSAVMSEMLSVRHEIARLLGFDNYAEYSLARKMARSTAEVVGFLQDLARRCRPAAERELEAVAGFAREEHGLEELAAWDVPFYSEKLRARLFDFSQEELRPYFPAPRVIEGMFRIVRELYGLDIRGVEGVDVWDPQVQFFDVHDEDGDLRGRFYLDLYARPHKRGGAWMHECIVRKRSGDDVQAPVAYLNCNFAPPSDDAPSLLTHSEVTTLFHEFGHGLHHLLTRVDYPGVAGINGVAWDAVELPSQLMENWTWEAEALAFLSGHHRTGEPLPARHIERLRASRRFQAGMQMVRQLEFALFDFRLHLEHDPGSGARVQETLADVRRQVAVVTPPEFNRFAHAFTHIFGGGYAAGYYSYKWAEVLASDAYSRFEEDGIFDRLTGRDFMRTVLEQGGSRDAMDLFVEFRGREPEIGPLLRHSGMAVDDAA